VTIADSQRSWKGLGGQVNPEVFPVWWPREPNSSNRGRIQSVHWLTGVSLRRFTVFCLRDGTSSSVREWDINTYKVSVGRHRRRWVYNIRTDRREIGWKVVNWIHLAQDRDQWRTLVNTIMTLRVRLKAGNFLSSWVTISFSRITLVHDVIFTVRAVR